MKSIAALFLTIALALFPLSGNRAVAAVAAHASTAVQPHGHAAEDHHHGADLRDGSGAAAVGMGESDGGERPDPLSPCGGDHSSSACCNLNCHAMAPAVGVSAKVRVMTISRVESLALPLPSGIRFEGLLRPPRAS